MNYLSIKRDLFFIVHLLAVYVILIAFHGFLFAANDVVDVMTYAKYLRNPELYPGDFYVQHISDHIPNERFIFSHFLALFGKGIAWASLLLHCLFSCLLFAGMYRISALYINKTALRWLGILILLIPLYHIGPGDCELYYNMFIASLMAKSIGIWSLYYFLKDKNDLAFLLLIPVVLIHPTVGAQLFLIFLAVSFILLLVKRQTKGWIGLLLFLISAGIWLFLLQFNLLDDESLSMLQLYEIFEFRLAHHFFPQYFSFVDWIAALMMLAFALLYFQKMDSEKSLLFILILILGMIIYTVSVIYLPNEINLSSQWFKNYIWLELFGVIALLALLEKNMASLVKLIPEQGFSIFLIVAGLAAGILIHIPGETISDRKYEFFYTDHQSDEKGIAERAKTLTPSSSTFIVPMHFTEFTFYSQRSVYINYKTVVHRKDALGEWYRRIQQVYRINILDRLQMKDLYQTGNVNYRNTSYYDLYMLSLEGVDHMIAFRSQEFPLLPLLYSNESYSIYALPRDLLEEIVQ